MAKKATARKAAKATAEPASNEPSADAQTPLESLDGGARGACEVDRVIHQPIRLAIVSSLAVNPVLTFNELKGLLELSDGNLSVHARKLEEAGYVACDKGFAGRVPRSEYSLTAAGQRALSHYLGHMEALIQAVREG